jgi:transmembrane sensor
MKESVTKQLLFDFFDGKTTCVQRKLVEEWLGSSLAHEEVFYRYLDEWERKCPQFFPDSENARATYDALLNGRLSAVKFVKITPPAPQQKGRVWALRLAVAASVLLTALFFRESLLYRTYESAPGEPYAFTLPDGSQVTLNANSGLRVPRFTFGHPTREVQLTGEAEFSVTHTKEHTPFRVVMDDHYQIDVLGTEFTAYSRERGKRVYLKKGKVKLILIQIYDVVFFK